MSVLKRKSNQLSGQRTAPLAPPRPTTAGFTAKLFRALGDPTRVRILEILLDGERTVGELVEVLDGLQGRISSHLSCLRWCGFVTTRREGRNVYYRVSDRKVKTMLRLAREFISENGTSIDMCRIVNAEEHD